MGKTREHLSTYTRRGIIMIHTIPITSYLKRNIAIFHDRKLQGNIVTKKYPNAKHFMLKVKYKIPTVLGYFNSIEEIKNSCILRQLQYDDSDIKAIYCL